MKIKNILIAIALGLTLTSQAQTNTNFISGDLKIQFNTRTQPGIRGVTDNYNVNVNVCNSAIFNGTIKHYPYVEGGLLDNPQSSKLDFALDASIVNPKNVSQTRQVGKFDGSVGIGLDGTYNFSNLRIVVDSIGMAQGFESKARGISLGKPLVRPKGWSDKLKEAVSITRNVGGKQVSIKVSKYDKLEFQTLVLPQGPLASFSAATVSGSMVFDYSRNSWFFYDLSLSYALEGRQVVDRVTGSLRWIKDKNYVNNGLSYYEVDIRINESNNQNEGAVFSNAGDESSFFEVDNSLSYLGGKISYKDTFANGGTVVSSEVKLDMTANKLNKAQCIALAKLFVFAAVVPMNAE